MPVPRSQGMPPKVIPSLAVLPACRWGKRHGMATGKCAAVNRQRTQADNYAQTNLNYAKQAQRILPSVENKSTSARVSQSNSRRRSRSTIVRSTNAVRGVPATNNRELSNGGGHVVHCEIPREFLRASGDWHYDSHSTEDFR